MFKKLLVFLAAMYMAVAFAAVDINKAMAADLDGVKGIGPVISSRILDERKKGNFKDWNDFIERVKGIGEVNAGKFSAEGLTVGGASYKGATPAAASTPAAAKKDDKPAAKADAKPAAAAAATTTAAAAAPAAAPAAANKADDAKAKKDADKKAKADEKKKKADDAKAKADADKAAKADAKKAKSGAKADAPQAAASAAKK
jgi:competence protein ComEA